MYKLIDMYIDTAHSRRISDLDIFFMLAPLWFLAPVQVSVIYVEGVRITEKNLSVISYLPDLDGVSF